MDKNSTKPRVFVFGDDPGASKFLGWLIEGVGLNAEVYASPSAFPESYLDSSPGCLVVDVCMPNMSGLALLKRLRSDGAAGQ